MVAVIVLIASAVSVVWRTTSSFAPYQAGFTWCCQAKEVDATWVTPTLTGLDPMANESSWIGVQTGNGFFFQVGVVEHAQELVQYYLPFWSDGAVKYEPQFFSDGVNPGDTLHAEIRRSASKWVATISDLTAHWTASASISGASGGAQAEDAEWIDEDPVVKVGGQQPTNVSQISAMPTTTCELMFTSLHVNGVSPTTASMTPFSFVDATGHTFDPAWSGNDAFTVYERPAPARPNGQRLGAC